MRILDGRIFTGAWFIIGTVFVIKEQLRNRVGVKVFCLLQERLIKKLGPNAYPFFFQLSPQTTPASVTLQPAPGDTGKPCGVDYELKTYVADSLEDKPHKRYIPFCV